MFCNGCNPFYHVEIWLNTFAISVKTKVFYSITLDFCIYLYLRFVECGIYIVYLLIQNVSKMI